MEKQLDLRIQKTHALVHHAFTELMEEKGFEAYNFTGGFRYYAAVAYDKALIQQAYACGMDR